MSYHLDVIFSSTETYRLPLWSKSVHERNFIMLITKRLPNPGSSQPGCDYYLGTLEACSSPPTSASETAFPPTQVAVKWAPSAWQLGAKYELCREGKFYSNSLAGTQLEGSLVPRFYGGYGGLLGPSCIILEYCGGSLEALRPDELK